MGRSTRNIWSVAATSSCGVWRIVADLRDRQHFDSSDLAAILGDVAAFRRNGKRGTSSRDYGNDRRRFHLLCFPDVPYFFAMDLEIQPSI